MKPTVQSVARHYKAALQKHLRQRRGASLTSAKGLGGEALSAGLETLDLAKLHENALVAEILPRFPAAQREALTKRAGVFFAVAITPIEENERSAREATALLKKFIETLSIRTVELATSNLELRLEISQRKAAEAALRESQAHYSALLKRSDALQEQMRDLSRQILSAHEDERRRISRELHDVVAQTLTGINIRLATLKREASEDTRGLDRNILRTQRLVEHSVNIVHQFARELRPAVLDDLGLIPALHSYLKSFSARTGIHARLTAFAEIEKLDIERRTVLFRVAQEALTNVGRHSEATQVEVTIRKERGLVTMKIQDNGKSFDAEATARRNGGKRLGLLGMKERVQMVGGKFGVESAAGKGATITAQFPLRNGASAR